MSLDPKDLRIKLDPDIHRGLDICADLAGKGLAELAEDVIGDYVRRRVHEAAMICERMGDCSGTSGKTRESLGKGGKGGA